MAQRRAGWQPSWRAAAAVTRASRPPARQTLPARQCRTVLVSQQGRQPRVAGATRRPALRWMLWTRRLPRPHAPSATAAATPAWIAWILAHHPRRRRRRVCRHHHPRRHRHRRPPCCHSQMRHPGCPAPPPAGYHPAMTRAALPDRRQAAQSACHPSTAAGAPTLRQPPHAHARPPQPVPPSRRHRRQQQPRLRVPHVPPSHAPPAAACAQWRRQAQGPLLAPSPQVHHRRHPRG